MQGQALAALGRQERRTRLYGERCMCFQLPGPTDPWHNSGSSSPTFGGGRRSRQRTRGISQCCGQHRLTSRRKRLATDPCRTLTRRSVSSSQDLRFETGVFASAGAAIPTVVASATMRLATASLMVLFMGTSPWFGADGFVPSEKLLTYGQRLSHLVTLASQFCASVLFIGNGYPSDDHRRCSPHRRSI